MSKTDWLKDKKWGVFVHYLYQNQNQMAPDGELPWDEHVSKWDVKELAKQLHEVGAGYFCFTLQQQNRYLAVPSKVHEEVMGLPRGVVTPHRDIIPELYEELSKYGIDLMLYFTGDGPFNDGPTDDPYQAGVKYGYTTHAEPVTLEFVKKWSRVLEELAVRYGKMIKGWWLDGCHPCIAFDEEKWGIMADAIHKGNPDAIITFNASIIENVTSFSPLDDYCAGERSWFDQLPQSRFVDGDKQWHIFTYLGYDHNTFGVHDGWGKPGCRFTKEYLYDFVKAATDKEGVVTIDVRMDRYGKLDSEQFSTIKVLKSI